jgi:hypothetical protein
MIDVSTLTLHIPTLLAARNERGVMRDMYVDLSAVVDIISDYVALSLMDDPYVHSSTILRIAQAREFWMEKDLSRFDTQLAMFVISAFLEMETWMMGDFNTPDECLREIFSDDFLDIFRSELIYVPVICALDELGDDIFVPDLFACSFLARAFGTIAETSREVEAREEKRLFFPNEESNVGISLIDLANMTGEEYELSEFDEWAEGQNFPWDGEIGDS